MVSAGTKAAAMPLGLRLSLSVMMFLQFAIWGAWFVVLGKYLDSIHFSREAIGSIYGTMALGSIFAPLFVGQIADRYFASEKLMGILHLAGAGLLYWLAHIQSETGFYWVALLYALVYSPTLALSNAIAFTHVPDGQRDFPSIRVLGTIGWIVANLLVGRYLVIVSNQPLLLAACFSVSLGVISFVLPHTPPKGQAGDSLPFLRAVGLLREPSFAVFFGVSFVITIVLAFYYSFTAIFLVDELHVQDVASVMTIGQLSEMLLLPLLPFFLARWGMKWVLAVGMLAWGVRYGIFALGEPTWLVIASLALHGICYDFFFAAGFIHVDNKAPAAIRGSAQSLFTFLTYGVGMWLGSELSGRVNAAFSHPVIESWSSFAVLDVQTVTNWSGFWTVPALGVMVALAIFVVAFHDRGRGEQVKPGESLIPAPATSGVE